MSNLQLSESDLELGEKILEHLQKNVISKLWQFLQIADDKNENLKASTDSNKETQKKIRIKISHMSHIIENETIDENNSKILEKSYEELKDLLKSRKTNNLLTQKDLYVLTEEELRLYYDNDKDITGYLNILSNNNKTSTADGGKKSKKLPKKEILGKMRSIYKIPGDRKEYLKHNGKLITVEEYKKIMKAKPKKVKKTKSKK